MGIGWAALTPRASRLVGVLLLLVSDAAASARNILFLMIDDGGFEWQAYPELAPNMARFTQRAVSFERAYTAVSSCSPSRAAVLTGRPTHENGMYGLHQWPGNFQANRWLVDGFGAGDPGNYSLPNLLNLHGYKTGIIGKHHVGPLAAFAFTHGVGGDDGHCWVGAFANAQTDTLTPRQAACSKESVVEYNDKTRNATAMRLRARTFLREVGPSTSFFLYVGFGDTHRGCHPQAFCELYGNRTPRRANDAHVHVHVRPSYMTMCMTMCMRMYMTMRMRMHMCQPPRGSLAGRHLLLGRAPADPTRTARVCVCRSARRPRQRRGHRRLDAALLRPHHSARPPVRT